ncbi:hypothetical protein I317_05935 [Kwoniella heveanensis CBS 569]|nr:hypothetical protein I317_05935 [Kwoniella heveanensis CBS 569]
MHIFGALSDIGRQLSGEALHSVVSIDWRIVPEDTKDFILDNPKHTAFYVAKGVLLVAPALLTGPALAALGFTAVGPAAAASAQSAWAPIAARGIFATLQSAAMAGYGAPFVAGTVQGLVGTSLVYDAVANSSHAAEKEEEDDKAQAAMEDVDRAQGAKAVVM